MPDILKSSEDWQEDYPLIIRDPDGWDRQNFSFSWRELITFEEFERRAMESTVMAHPDRLEEARKLMNRHV